jgi:hypothetical protein
MKNKRARRPTGVNALGQSAPADIVTVNDLAEKPNEHLGQVKLVGVVAAVSQGQGFVCWWTSVSMLTAASAA